MGKAAYALTTDSPLELYEFPIGERINSTPRGRGGGPIAKRRTRIRLTTEEGVDWVYPQFSQDHWSLVFRIFTTAQLEFFATLDEAIGGDRDPFYFCPDVDESPQQMFLVRMDAPDWMPVSQDFIPEDGQIIGLFEITLNFTELSEAAQILS